MRKVYTTTIMSEPDPTTQNINSDSDEGDVDSSEGPMLNRRRAIAGLGLITAGVTTGASFANTSGSSTVSVDSDTTDAATVWDASEYSGDGKNSTFAYNNSTNVEPSWNVSTDSGGGVQDEGDLYVLETHSDDDLFLELFYSNVADLTDNYNYLNLDIELWAAETDPTTDGPKFTETLTLSTGRVSFTLDNATDGDLFAIAVSEGSWYTQNSFEGSVSPDFYLNVTSL